MIELGKLGAGGVPKGATPVLRDGVVVGALRSSNWKESAFAVVTDREWVYAKRKGDLTARWAADPEDTARFRARRASFWRSTWEVDLDGRLLTVESASVWRGTHRFVAVGAEIAISGSTGGWGQRPSLTVHAEGALTLEAQVFLLWMELLLRRRADSGAAAGTIAATGAVG